MAIRRERKVNPGQAALAEVIARQSAVSAKPHETAYCSFAVALR